MMRHVRRLLGFAVIPGFSLLASLALLPMIASRYGADGWSSLAIGQSMGAIVGVFVGMAWWMVGGNAVAAAPNEAAQRAIFRSSITSRGLVLVILTPIGTVATWLLVPAFHVEACVFVLGVALNGMGASWYFAGIGRPSRLIVNEGLVRLAGYVVSVGGVIAGLGLWWYATIMAAAGLVMLALNWLSIMGGSASPVGESGARSDLRAPMASRIVTEIAEAWRVIRAQSNGASARILAAAFWYGNLSLFSVLVPGSVGAFAAVHQLQRTANNALDTLSFAFMSWAGSATAAREQASRRRRLLTLIGAVATLVCTVWAITGPMVVEILYAGQVTFSRLEIALIGVVIALYLAMNATEMLVMVPAGLESRVFAVNQATGIGGLALLAVLAPTLGVLGGLLALVGVPLVSVGVYAWCLFRLTRAHASLPAAIERTA